MNKQLKVKNPETCSCYCYLASNRDVHVRFSGIDSDIAESVKVSNVGKAFIGVHEKRRQAATVIAERITGRELRDHERVAFHDRDRLHLCRDNIAIVSVSDRTRYNRPKKDGSSKYKGVSWQTSRQKWYAQIRIDGKSKNLGRYEDERSAALAYNNALSALGIDVAYMNDLSGEAANG